MSYSRDVYLQASDELARRRTEAEGVARALHDRVCRQYPRAAELEQQMAGSVGVVARAVVAGGDVEAAVRAAAQQNLAAQEELSAILRSAGEHATDFSPHYTCPLCQDTGYIGREMCSCFKALLAEYAGRQLTCMSGMKPAKFEDMDLRFYSDLPDAHGESPRTHMADVLEFCRCYGENFTPDADSLLLFGPTGTGKTHAALSIARLAAERGYTVVYGPVQQLLHRVEREHFGKEEGDAEDTMISCDLLVLDDIGTELTSPFYTATLYTILNGRLLGGRPTIISTNLSSPAAWQARYGEQITSRVNGTYTPLVFVGSDIRQAKLSRDLRG